MSPVAGNMRPEFKHDIIFSALLTKMSKSDFSGKADINIVFTFNPIFVLLHRAGRRAEIQENVFLHVFQTKGI